MGALASREPVLDLEADAESTLAAPSTGQRSADRLAARQLADEALLKVAVGIATAGAVSAPGRSAPVLDGADDPLIDALRVLADLEGLRVTASGPPTEADNSKASSLASRLATIAYASRFQLREVELPDGWWRRPGPSLIGELGAASGAAAQPVALVCRGDAYAIQAGPDAPPRPIDAALAARLGKTAFMVYPALPDRLDRRGVWSFALHGLGRDITRLAVAALLVALVGLIVPVATAVIVGSAVPDGRVGLAGQMTVLLVAAGVGTAGFQLVRSLALLRIITRIDLRLQSALWGRILELPAEFFRRYMTGDLAQRVLGIEFARRLLSGATLTGLLGAVFSLTSLALMFFFDARLAIYGLLFAIVVGLAMLWIGRRRVRLERDVFIEKGDIASLLIQLIGNIVKLRLAGAEERALARWARKFADQRRKLAQAGRMGNLQEVLSNILMPVGALGVFLIIGEQAGVIDVAAFSAFNTAFAQFTAGLVALGQSMSSALIAVPLLERVRPICDAAPEVRANQGVPPSLSGRIALAGLSFRYREDGPWTIQDVSLDVAPAEFVAIVGPSGSGKTTLLRLLLGFETPQQGAVLYDGNNLCSLDVRLVRRQIGTVLQNVQLVPGSIYENIAGAGHYSREEVMEAARAAGLAAHIEAMPMGLETMIAEGASTFSGGQRQLMLIARALVRKPRIVLFDEATSALDNATQATVSASLRAMQATRIVIAHRLSTIRFADRIIVMQRGQIVEEGKYDALIARGGEFFELARRQIL
jgi:NHLM bacteriocin system ABC transporter ATP-binding protein